MNDISDYINHLRNDRGCATGTIRSYQWRLRDFSEWLDGRDISPSLVRQYLEHLQTAGQRPRTRAVSLTCIRSYTTWRHEARGAAEVILDRTTGVRRPRLDIAQRAVPTDAEVQRLLEAPMLKMLGRLPRQRYERGRADLVIHLLLMAGLRRAEIIALDTSDITPTQLRVRCGKGGITRWVPVAEPLLRAIQRWSVERAFFVARHDHQSPALIPIDKTRRLSDTAFSTIWRDVASLAGLDPAIYQPHGCRHWCASQVAQSTSVATASAWLGHASVATTYNYLKTDRDKLIQAAGALSRHTAFPVQPGHTELRWDWS